MSLVPTASQMWEQGQQICICCEDTTQGDISCDRAACAHGSVPVQAAQAQLEGRIQLQNMWQHLSPPSRGGDAAEAAQGSARQGGPGATRSTSATPRGTSGWSSQPSQSPGEEEKWHERHARPPSPGWEELPGELCQSLWQGGIMGSSSKDGRDTGRCPGGATSLLSHPRATERAPHSPGAHPRQPGYGRRMSLDEIKGIWEWALQQYQGKAKK